MFPGMKHSRRHRAWALSTNGHYMIGCAAFLETFQHTYLISPVYIYTDFPILTRLVIDRLCTFVLVIQPSSYAPEVVHTQVGPQAILRHFLSRYNK